MKSPFIQRLFLVAVVAVLSSCTGGSSGKKGKAVNALSLGNYTNETLGASAVSISDPPATYSSVTQSLGLNTYTNGPVFPPGIVYNFILSDEGRLASKGLAEEITFGSFLSEVQFVKNACIQVYQKESVPTLPLNDPSKIVYPGFNFTRAPASVSVPERQGILNHLSQRFLRRDLSPQEMTILLDLMQNVAVDGMGYFLTAPCIVIGSSLDSLSG